jgi:peptidoglycan LD-endopeptidase CwlK
MGEEMKSILLVDLRRRGLEYFKFACLPFARMPLGALLIWSACLLGCAHPVEAGEAAATDAPISITQVTESKPKTDAAMQKLVAAYPDFLQAADGNFIVWKDGTRMVWDDGRGTKTFAQLEADPDIQDMFTFAYPRDSVIFQEDFDPGRIRNEAFFKKMYGATQAAASANLVNVDWLGGDARLRVTRVNGVDSALGLVSTELLALPMLKRYLTNPGGTFNWRVIAGTTRLSAHSFGMAIDINVVYSDYWRWSAAFKAGKPLAYHNQIPLEIVHIFERHGFVWGGKWYHYDTMHFEYRPELL